MASRAGSGPAATRLHRDCTRLGVRDPVALDRRIDRGKKLAIYAREGVGHVWLVNPIAETVESYRLEHGRWLLLGTHVGDAAARIEPFDAVELELWRLWGRSEPR